ncbi:MAG: carbohydrate binding family 9 domain-containing protein [Acidobacteria bacterium]|nr:carbohydrate binding family 9 domain-containing protein [Acidobacteriota bacterium]
MHHPTEDCTMTPTRRLLLACGALLLPLTALGQETAPTPAAAEAPPASEEIRRFEIRPATSAIKVDAVLDEPAWADALVIDLPYEWFPGDNVRPPVDTECLVTFSKSTLYVAFRAFDPEPGKIRAHLMDRDAIVSYVQDDHVGIQIDPFDDERQAVQFRSNPLGVQVDGTFNEIEGAEDFAWDAIWDSAGRITDDGYVVEMAIPFQQLRFPRTTGPQTWGFEAFRNYPRSDRYRISSKYTDRDKECTLCQENKVTGFVGIEPGLNLELAPTLTAVRTDVRNDFPDGGLEKDNEDLEPALNLRWGITTNLALSATVNPDFSQVEADTAQLDVNTRFALFFEEKRPFFLEGADYFETPLQAVFTRTVADPDWGIKLTGKEGKGAVGVYVTDDAQNNVLLPSNQTSRFLTLDGNVKSAVVRYRHDIGNRSTLGVLYTGRDGDDYSNQVGGLDGFFRLDTSNSFRVQYLTSSTEYPDQFALDRDQPLGNFDGDAYRASFLHLTRNWFATVSYEDLDKDFRADNGFIPRVDVRTTEGIVERSFWGDSESWFRRVIVGAEVERTENHDGLKTDEGYEVYANFNGPLQSFAELRVSDRDEFFAGTTYSLTSANLFAQVKPTGRVNLDIYLEHGDAIDFTNGQKGTLTEISPGFQLRLGRHVNWRFDHIYQTLDVDGGELFSVNLTQTTFVYQFNVRTFARAIFQYQDLAQNPDLYSVPVDENSEELFTQLLFSYKINPRTVLFAGYSDNQLGFDEVPLTRTDRTFFLKIGYAFLF